MYVEKACSIFITKCIIKLVPVKELYLIMYNYINSPSSESNCLVSHSPEPYNKIT